MLRGISTFLTARLRQWIPDPFVFAILLVAILVLYWIYDKIVGIDNMKLG